MTKCTMTKDEYVNEVLDFRDYGIFFTSVKNPIMEKWEEPFIKMFIKKYLIAYKPKTVLEAGFGYGFTSQEIQDFGVEKHIIVEAHPVIYQKLLEWAVDKPSVVPVFGFVEDFLYPEGVDLIFDDRHPLTSYGETWMITQNNIPHSHLVVWNELKMMGMNEQEYIDFYESVRQWQ